MSYPGIAHAYAAAFAKNPYRLPTMTNDALDILADTHGSDESIKARALDLLATIRADIADDKLKVSAYDVMSTGCWFTYRKPERS